MFAVFLDFYLKEGLRWNYVVAFHDDHWRSLLYVQRMVSQNIVRHDGLAIHYSLGTAQIITKR